MAEAPEGARLAVIREYAAEVVGCTPDRVTTVSRFEDGNRHDVYKVTCLGADGAAEDLVVRVSLGDDPAERSQAEREARVLEKVGGVAAPRLRDFRLTSPWFATPVLSMSFVPGHQLELSTATSAEIEQLGSVVARVHGQPVDALTQSLSEIGTIVSYADGRLQSILTGLRWVRDPLPAPLRDRLRDAADSIGTGWETRRAAESFTTGETLALLHGDIALGNIPWDPDPVFIDWEYARLGDPSDEIAYLFDQNGLAVPQREAFWRGYQARISSEVRLAHVIERVSWWEPLTLLGSALWWVERWVRRTEADAATTDDPAVPRDAGYYFDQVLLRKDRLEPLLDRA